MPKRRKTMSKATKHPWYKVFLRELEKSRQVQAASAKAGKGMSWVYRCRKLDSAFAAEWDRVVEEAGGLIQHGTPDKPVNMEWHKRFLNSLTKIPNIKLACESAGVARITAFDHRRRFPDFAKAWDEAIEDGIDVLELSAMRRAKATSDKLAIFLLSAHRPKVYGRQRFEHSGPGGMPIETQTTSTVLVLPDNGRGDHLPAKEEGKTE